jgi:histone-lysine N-methyltransferase SETD3
LNGLNLKVCEYGNGVFANKDFESDEIMTRIPLEIMLSTAFHQRSDLQLIVQNDSMLKSMESLVLTLQLLQEDQDPNSFYRPYLNVLPRKLPKLPLAYNLSDLDSLKGSHVQCKIQ